nr:unnamed protein product [Digitaria exilis]
MARLQASLLATVAVAIAAAAMLATPAYGASYTVGNPGGSWDTQTNLTNWASSISFHPGDELVFNYDATAHDVVEVTHDGYRSCSPAASGAVSASALRSDADTVQLNATGTRYFVCGVVSYGNGAAPGFSASLGSMLVAGGERRRLGIRALLNATGTRYFVCGVVSYGNGAAPGQ